jgi:hypothetical protein
MRLPIEIIVQAVGVPNLIGQPAHSSVGRLNTNPRQFQSTFREFATKATLNGTGRLDVLDGALRANLKRY